MPRVALLNLDPNQLLFPGAIVAICCAVTPTVAAEAINAAHNVDAAKRTEVCGIQTAFAGLCGVPEIRPFSKQSDVLGATFQERLFTPTSSPAEPLVFNWRNIDQNQC